MKICTGSRDDRQESWSLSDHRRVQMLHAAGFSTGDALAYGLTPADLDVLTVENLRRIRAEYLLTAASI